MCGFCNVCVCMCGYCNVWVCMCVCVFVCVCMCVCVCVGVLTVYVLVFTVFLYCFFCVYLLLFVTRVRTTGTE